MCYVLPAPRPEDGHAHNMNPLRRLNATTAPAAVLLIRLMVGGIFLSEGVQKFLFPDANGAARFAKIGIPHPQLMAPFVGGVEVLCGLLILMGWSTRLAAIPLLIDISVAIISTKIPILLDHGFWHFSLPKVNQYGLWAMLHEARTDFSMLLGLLFLLTVGAGSLSADARAGKTSGGASKPPSEK
jgi:putative oxidoreductase